MAEPLLYYEVHGKGERCILWVHGLLSGRSHWMPNLPAFNDSYRSVVVELMGHGRSASPEDPASYAPDHYMEEFNQIREAVGADRWYSVGQSLGGALSLRYGLQHPDRVIAQAFTNSTSALGPASFFARIRENMDAAAETARRDGRSVLDKHPLNPSRARSYAADIKAELMKDYALHNPIGIAMTAAVYPALPRHPRGDEAEPCPHIDGGGRTGRAVSGSSVLRRGVRPQPHHMPVRRRPRTQFAGAGCIQPSGAGVL